MATDSRGVHLSRPDKAVQIPVRRIGLIVHNYLSSEREVYVKGNSM